MRFQCSRQLPFPQAFVALVPLSFLLPRLIAKKYVGRNCHRQLAAGSKCRSRFVHPRFSDSFFRQGKPLQLSAWAFLEGVGFLACVACVIEHRMIVMAVAAAMVVCFYAFPRKQIGQWDPAARQSICSDKGRRNRALLLDSSPRSFLIQSFLLRALLVKNGLEVSYGSIHLQPRSTKRRQD